MEARRVSGRKRLAVTVASVFVILHSAPVAAASDALAAGFVDPPPAAKPRVWWHWMSGNVSAEGARLDLEWMQRVGVGGVHAFSGQGRGVVPVVPKLLPFMSEGWKAVFRQSLDQAHAAGMEVGIAGSPGWSETGGPWVAPADAMKKYVWSELVVEGGRPVQVPLPQPPHATGPFQGAAMEQPKGAAYGDAAVIAFPTPALEQPLPAAAWTTGAGPVDLSTIGSDALSATPVKLTPSAGTREVWLEATYPRPVTLGAVAFGVAEGAAVRIEADDGQGGLRTVMTGQVEPPLGVVDHAAAQMSLSFAPVTTRRLRIVLSPPALSVRGVLRAPRADAFSLTELRPIAGARVNGYEAKAGFVTSVPPKLGPTPPATAEGAVDRARVIDLTDRLRPDGTLDWTPPPGRWTVVRLGWSLTGKTNGPAEPSSTGLEVDKFDAVAVRRYLATYLEMYQQATGGRLGPSGIQTLLTDSWEAGFQNWTPAMLTEFRARRGYDATPFLPVLTGRVVESAETSERFLFDFRRTLKELASDNHYAVLARELKARGVGYYTEALGDSPRGLLDGMTVKARADIPTAEFWYRPFATGPGQPPLKADLEEAASAAHVYGKPLVAAESLTVGAPTDPWAFSPAMLKPVADEIFARGVNRMLIHESHHQPLVDAKPGLRMSIFGQFFNRNDTWAEEAGPWVSYLARTSYLLQQGRYVADVAYVYGEDRNLTELFLERVNTDVPKGYAYDYVNPEALLTLLSVRDGRIVTPSGMTYRVLFLGPGARRLTLPALEKIRDLVAGGAVLAAEKPVGGLGLASPDDEVRRIADEFWGEGSAEGRAYGKGRVYASLAKALAAEGVAPDVAFAGQTLGAEILTSHRRTAEADIYFVSNQSAEAQSLRARFRVTGKAPEIWRAETGAREAISYAQVPGGVEAPLELAPKEALFVVFRRPATAAAWTAPPARRTPLATVSGDWRVSFEPGRGAPASATFDRLISWPQSTDPGIRYFSGRAVYRIDLNAEKAWLRRGRRLELDLGDVRELASVRVNGRRLGQAWHAPYVIDLTGALKPGRNRLEIEVVNLWPNRLIGDRQPGATPVAFAPGSPYGANSPLLPSGLLGPVRLNASDRAPASPGGPRRR
jgi:hypothetical protein